MTVRAVAGAGEREMDSQSTGTEELVPIPWSSSALLVRETDQLHQSYHTGSHWCALTGKPESTTSNARAVKYWKAQCGESRMLRLDAGKERKLLPMHTKLGMLPAGNIPNKDFPLVFQLALKSISQNVLLFLLKPPSWLQLHISYR
jgi:hypothetical protein